MTDWQGFTGYQSSHLPSAALIVLMVNKEELHDQIESVSIREYFHNLADNLDPGELRSILHNYVDFQPENVKNPTVKKLSKYLEPLPKKLSQDLVQSILKFQTPFEQSTISCNVSKCFQKAVYSNLSQLNRDTSQRIMAWLEITDYPLFDVPPQFGKITKWTDDYYKGLHFANTFILSTLKEQNFHNIPFRMYSKVIRNFSIFAREADGSSVF